jgi:hypothetical protein
VAQEVSVAGQAADEMWGPAEFMRMVAGELAGVGLDAHLANSNGSYYITVCGLTGMSCEVTPGDHYGSVACCYWPDLGVTYDAANVIALAVSLLTGENVAGQMADRQLAAGHSLISVAGQELKAMGFDVWLDVDTNQVLYEAVTELAVTCSDGNDDPRAVIDGAGGVTWVGRYPAVDAASAANVARTVAAVLTRPLTSGVLEKQDKKPCEHDDSSVLADTWGPGGARIG